jgi:short-subunit dehydrogenase
MYRGIFSGKRVVITGASAGIGREFAVQLQQAGADVCVVARRESLLRDLVQKLNDRRSGSASYEVADLGDDVALKNLAAKLSEQRVDILVNNAGRGSFGRFETLDLEHEVDLVKLNVIAPMRLTHAVLPQMKKRGNGGLIFLASIAGFQPLPYMTTYAGTKAFDLSFGVGLREELRGTGVRVLTVAPGPVATEFGGVARVPGEFTNVGRDQVEPVVRESLSAFVRDIGWVVPCTQAKFLSLPSRILPRTWTTFLTEKTLKGALKAKESGAYEQKK